MFKMTLDIYKAYWMLFTNYWYIYVFWTLVLGVLVLKHKDKIISGTLELLTWMQECITNYKSRKTDI